MKKIKNTACLECGKEGVHSKGMCQSCYSKAYRNTKIGKEKMNIYNATKGKEAQKRYRQKINHKKPAKRPTEKFCICGDKSVVKGFCFTCYHREYKRKKFGYKERKPKKEFDFNEVLNFVKSGYTIRDASSKCNINTGRLYKEITELQKQELRLWKAISKITINDEF